MTAAEPGRDVPWRRPERLRVLFLNDTARNGGPGRTLFFILKFLDPARVERLVVVPREGLIAELMRTPGISERLWLEPGLIENPVEPWGRPMERGDFEAPVPLRAARAVGNVGRTALGLGRLVALVRRERIQVLFCNGTSANFAGAAISGLTGVPAVWHAFYTRLAPALVPLHRRLAASEGVKRILCVSRPVARLFEHVPSKVSVVHDALDLDEYAPDRAAAVLRAEQGWAEETVVFGSVGRILPRKGYAEMVRAARRALDLLEPAERVRCRFAVLGDTPEDERVDHLAECRSLVSALGVGEWFHFLGHREDVKPFARDFDVMVVPSVYPDPLPRAVLEGMALGTPVLAFDVGGIGEAVEDGRSGTLVPPGDVDALARAMVRYLRDPERRRAEGRAARATVEARFGAPAHARVIEEALRAAAGRTG